MAELTSVLSIDVKDEAFKRLKADMDGFLKTMDQVKSLTIGATGARPNSAMQQEARKAQENMVQWNKSLKTGGENLAKFSTSLTKLTANIIFDSGKKLVGAFTSITKAIVGTGGLLSGIASMATLAGIIKLSHTTQQRNFQAAALGINPADMGRYGATYGQMYDVGNVMETLAVERERPGSLLMANMGLSPQQAQNMSTESLFEAFDKAFTKYVKTVPQGGSQEMLNAYGFSMMTPLDYRRRKAIGESTHDELMEAERNARKYQLADPKAWSRFAMMRGVGMNNLETVAQNLITPLLQPIDDAFHKIFGKMESGQGGFGKAIDMAKETILSFNQALDTGNWKQFFQKVADDIKSVIQALKPLFEELKPILKDLFDVALGELNEGARMFKQMMIEFSNSSVAKMIGISALNPGDSNFGLGVTYDLSSKAKQAELFKEAGSKYNVDPALLFGMAMQESRMNPNAVSPKGAEGVMQFMPATSKRYGIDPFNPGQAVMGGGHYMSDLLQMFGGDEEMALAGYNWGEGNVMKLRGNKNWKASLPQETRDFLTKVKMYRMQAAHIPEFSNTPNGRILPMDRSVHIHFGRGSSNANPTIVNKRQAASR